MSVDTVLNTNLTSIYDKCWSNPAYMTALGYADDNDKYMTPGPVPSFDINKKRETIPNLAYMYRIEDQSAFYEFTPDVIPLTAEAVNRLDINTVDCLHAQLTLCLTLVNQTWNGQRCYYRKLATPCYFTYILPGDQICCVWAEYRLIVIPDAIAGYFPITSFEIIASRGQIIESIPQPRLVSNSCTHPVVIREQFRLQNPDFQLHPYFMQKLFEYYDTVAFKCELKKQLANSNMQFVPVLGKGTSSGGSCRSDGRLAINPLIFSGFKPNTTKIGGLMARDLTEAYILTFEHELIHLYFFAIKDCKEMHGSKFKNMAYDLFGHTDIRHDMQRVTVANIGQRITFKYKGKDIIGTVMKRNQKTYRVLDNATKIQYTVPISTVTETVG